MVLVEEKGREHLIPPKFSWYFFSFLKLTLEIDVLVVKIILVIVTYTDADSNINGMHCSRAGGSNLEHRTLSLPTPLL